MIHYQMLPLLSLILGVLVFALWKGGAPERCGAGVVIAMASVQLGIRAFIPNYWTILDIGPFVSDAIGFLGFGVIALNARRLWPLVATALQMVSLGAHFARWASVEVLPWIYAIARGAPTVLSIFMLAVATILHIRSRRRGEIDPGWQDWSAISARRAGQALGEFTPPIQA